MANLRLERIVAILHSDESEYRTPAEVACTPTASGPHVKREIPTEARDPKFAGTAMNSHSLRWLAPIRDSSELLCIDNIPTGRYVLFMNRVTARDKLLDAALALIRERGFSATTVDALCERAGVTKGAFFHHFGSKHALGVAAAEHWSAVTGALFEQAEYHGHADPLDRLLGYVELRRVLLQGDIPEVTCVVGTMVQETYAEHPGIRDACAMSIFGHAATLVDDIAEAMAKYGVGGGWSAESLAAHTQAVLQGAFILAKAQNDMTVAMQSVDHLRRYIELLFTNSQPNPTET